MIKSESTPLYKTIYDNLLEQIHSGYYAPNEKLPSEKELMEIYAVSRITVTKALSQLVQEHIIYRIQGKGSYVSETVPEEKETPSPVSKPVNLTEHFQKKIGVICPSIRAAYMMQLLIGINESLPFPDYFITVTTSESPQQEKYALEFFHQNDYDGIIIFPGDTETYNEMILMMQMQHFPIVLIDRYFPGISCNYVISNNAQGGELAVDHLAKLGHQRIAFCASATLSEQTTKLRYQGFCNGVKKLNLTSAYPSALDNLYQNHGFENLIDLIREQRITGVVVSNSGTALKLSQLCQKAGVRIPEDLSMVCFDNPVLNANQGSFFTYLDQSAYQLGCHAAQLIQKLILSPDKEIVEPVILPQTLVINQSTAPVQLY